MTQTTIEGTIDQVIDVVSNVSGINFAPSDPPSAVPGSAPFAIVYLGSGQARMQPVGAITYWDDVVVQCGVPLADMSLANRVLLPLGRLVMNAIFQGLRNGSIAPLNFEGLDYEYGPFTWGGVDQFGFSIVMNRVKTQVTLS